MDDNFGHIA